MWGEFVLYKIDFLNGNQPKLDLVWIKQWQLNKTFWIHWALLCWDTASERYNEEAAGWIFYIEMEWMNMEKRQYARVSKFCNSSSSWNLKIVFSNCLFFFNFFTPARKRVLVNRDRQRNNLLFAKLRYKSWIQNLVLCPWVDVNLFLATGLIFWWCWSRLS